MLFLVNAYIPYACENVFASREYEPREPQIEVMGEAQDLQSTRKLTVILCQEDALRQTAQKRQQEEEAEVVGGWRP